MKRFTFYSIIAFLIRMGNRYSIYVYLDHKEGRTWTKKYSIIITSKQSDLCKNLQWIVKDIKYHDAYSDSPFNLYMSKVTGEEPIFIYYPGSYEKNVCKVQVLYSWLYPRIPLLVGLRTIYGQDHFYSYKFLEEKVKKGYNILPDMYVVESTINDYIRAEFDKIFKKRKLMFVSGDRQRHNVNDTKRDLGERYKMTTFVPNSTIPEYGPQSILSRHYFHLKGLKTEAILSNLLVGLFGKGYDGINVYYRQHWDWLLMIEFINGCNERTCLQRKDEDGIYWVKSDDNFFTYNHERQIIELLDVCIQQINDTVTIVLDMKTPSDGRPIIYNDVEVTRIGTRGMANIIRFNHRPMNQPASRTKPPNILLNDKLCEFSKQDKERIQRRLVKGVEVYFLYKEDGSLKFVDKNPLMLEFRHYPKGTKEDYVPQGQDRIGFYTRAEGRDQWEELKINLNTKVTGTVSRVDTSEERNSTKVSILSQDSGAERKVQRKETETEALETSPIKIQGHKPSEVQEMVSSGDTEVQTDSDDLSESEENSETLSEKRPDGTKHEFPVKRQIIRSSQSNPDLIKNIVLGALTSVSNDIQGMIQNPKLNLEKLRGKITEKIKGEVENKIEAYKQIQLEDVIDNNMTPEKCESQWERQDQKDDGGSEQVVKIAGGVSGVVASGGLAGGGFFFYRHFDSVRFKI